VSALRENGLHPLPPGKIASIVTWLEMERPAALPRPEAPSGFALVPLEPPEPEAYRALFRAVGARWLWFSRLALETGELRRILEDPRVEVFRVRHGMRDIGLLELDFRHERECELAFLGILESHLGRGLGRWLIEEAIARAFRRPIRRLFVHTCTLDHPGALAFYRRAGFRACARAVEIADDPRLLGLLPEDAAPQVPLIRPDGGGRRSGREDP